MSYLISIGNNVALVDLEPLAPQPKSAGIQVTRRNHAADGSISEDGQYIILEYSALESAEMYQDVLDQFDLMDNNSAAVTIYARDSRWDFHRYNGIAVYPEMGREAEWRDLFPRNISILIHSLEFLTEP